MPYNRCEGVGQRADVHFAMDLELYNCVEGLLGV